MSNKFLANFYLFIFVQCQTKVYCTLKVHFCPSPSISEGHCKKNWLHTIWSKTFGRWTFFWQTLWPTSKLFFSSNVDWSKSLNSYWVNKMSAGQKVFGSTSLCQEPFGRQTFGRFSMKREFSTNQQLMKRRVYLFVKVSVKNKYLCKCQIYKTFFLGQFD